MRHCVCLPGLITLILDADSCRAEGSACVLRHCACLPGLIPSSDTVCKPHPRPCSTQPCQAGASCEVSSSDSVSFYFLFCMWHLLTDILVLCTWIFTGLPKNPCYINVFLPYHLQYAFLGTWWNVYLLLHWEPFRLELTLFRFGSIESSLNSYSKLAGLMHNFLEKTLSRYFYFRFCRESVSPDNHSCIISILFERGDIRHLAPRRCHELYTKKAEVENLSTLALSIRIKDEVKLNWLYHSNIYSLTGRYCEKELSPGRPLAFTGQC